MAGLNEGWNPANSTEKWHVSDPRFLDLSYIIWLLCPPLKYSRLYPSFFFRTKRGRSLRKERNDPGGGRKKFRPAVCTMGDGL